MLDAGFLLLENWSNGIGNDGIVGFGMILDTSFWILDEYKLDILIQYLASSI